MPPDWLPTFFLRATGRRLLRRGLKPAISIAPPHFTRFQHAFWTTLLRPPTPIAHLAWRVLRDDIGLFLQKLHVEKVE
ncbi:hypothetical protein EYF80_042234 [Liparis tanakae]|uniref:Uncharacterized protein n=1 Tax=Liparis tanakae TaxID=230148 RepID=A0A4Z2G1Y8_9TELE|nr:hypothetical protein EYF80_042234 [Liparis tanakae]